MVREFFRIVSSKEPTLEDFKSPRALGRRLPNPAVEREWAEGVSIYDDFDRACQVSRKFKFRLGHYIVRIRVPEERTLEYTQTFEDMHHFTIYAEPEEILALVEGAPVQIPGTPGD